MNFFKIQNHKLQGSTKYDRQKFLSQMGNLILKHEKQNNLYPTTHSTKNSLPSNVSYKVLQKHIHRKTHFLHC